MTPNQHPQTGVRRKEQCEFFLWQKSSTHTKKFKNILKKYAAQLWHVETWYPCDRKELKKNKTMNNVVLSSDSSDESYLTVHVSSALFCVSQCRSRTNRSLKYIWRIPCTGWQRVTLKPGRKFAFLDFWFPCVEAKRYF